MKTLPTIYPYTGSDGSEHLEDPNLKDVKHLAETIRKVCNLNVGDLASDQGLSKEQVVEVVELVEKELLRHPTVRPFKRDIMISDPLTIRVKDDMMSSCLNLLLIKEVGFCSPSKDLGIFILTDMARTMSSNLS